MTGRPWTGERRPCCGQASAERGERAARPDAAPPPSEPADAPEEEA